ncbi:MAG: DUF4870 domain-containing protein [Betaproteobacteria bacterium]|nr:DUF4870 domain-containing protein [Betaproteobacteria bacterium]
MSDTQSTTESNPMPNESERTFGMLVHLLGIVTWFIGPLIIWLMKKEEMPFVNDQGKEALNFQITLFIAGIAIMIVTAVLTAIIPILGIIASMLLSIVFWIGALVLLILAGIEANKGKYYRYPFSLRLIK